MPSWLPVRDTSGPLQAGLRAAGVALALFVGAAACVDGPVVEKSEPSPAQGVAAAGDAPVAPPDETSTTAETSSTTTKPKPKPATTTSEPEPPDDGEDEGNDGEDGAGDEGDDPGSGDGEAVPPDHAADSIDYVNQRRSDDGTSPLEEDPELTALAEGWAKQIAAEGNLYHNPNLFQDRPSRYRMVGENVAYNSVAGNINDAWWNSDGHRTNMLNESYTHIGVAFVQDDRSVWWAVQVFAG